MRHSGPQPHPPSHTRSHPAPQPNPLPAPARAPCRELERELSGLVTLRREWCLKLGRAAVTHFSRLCASYKKQLTALASSPELPEAEQSVSAAFLQPLEHLAALLRTLGASLDSDSFRAVWKLVALALNRSLFNDVATEARFSAHGAAQFGADCNALVRRLLPPAAAAGAGLSARGSLRCGRRSRLAGPGARRARLPACVAACAPGRPLLRTQLTSGPRAARRRWACSARTAPSPQRTSASCSSAAGCWPCLPSRWWR